MTTARVAAPDVLEAPPLVEVESDEELPSEDELEPFEDELSSGTGEESEDDPPLVELDAPSDELDEPFDELDVPSEELESPDELEVEELDDAPAPGSTAIAPTRRPAAPGDAPGDLHVAPLVFALSVSCTVPSTNPSQRRLELPGSTPIALMAGVNVAIEPNELPPPVAT